QARLLLPLLSPKSGSCPPGWERPSSSRATVPPQFRRGSNAASSELSSRSAALSMLPFACQRSVPRHQPESVRSRFPFRFVPAPQPTGLPLSDIRNSQQTETGQALSAASGQFDGRRDLERAQPETPANLETASSSNA